MSRCVYLTATGPASGKSAVALGVVELLSRRVERVGFFRPIVGRLPDKDVELIRHRYGIPIERIGTAFTAEELRGLEGGAPSADNGGMERALAAYKRIEAESDVVVVEGTDFTGASAPLEFDLNARLARELGGPVLAVVNGYGHTPEEVLERVRVSEDELERRGVSIVGIVVNRADPPTVEALTVERLARPADAPPLWTMPELATLRQPSIAELGAGLGATIVGDELDDLVRAAANVKVAAMTVPNLLDRIEPGTVLIAPGDRADLIVAAAATRQSTAHPSVAGLVLAGGLAPDRRVIRLIDHMGGAGSPLPLLLDETDTFETAIAASRIEGANTLQTPRKIDTALELFERSVDGAVLADRIRISASTVVTPLRFQYELVEAARAARAHLVFPEGMEERILEAADRLARRRVCDLTLLGPEDTIRRRVVELGLDALAERMADAEVHDEPPAAGDPVRVATIDPATSPLHDGFAKRYQELRAHKGTTLDQARDILADVSFFGSMMVHEGLADGVVSGAAHTTAHTVRPALEFIKTRPGVSIVSSVFFMLLADRVLVYGDCAVVPDPNAEQLADIAISSAETAAQFGIEPRIAMLSYSTGESGTGADVDKVRRATEWVRELRPDLPVEGPIQYDAAIDLTVGRAKLPGSDVAGRATVFVFPDLNTGNNKYKAVQRSADAMAVGPVLQGLNKPVNDLSRGTTVDDIVNTAAITAIQSRTVID